MAGRRPSTPFETDVERVRTTLDLVNWRSIKEVMERTGLKTHSAKKALRSLVWEGVVERKGKTKGTRYRLARRYDDLKVELDLPEILDTFFKIPLHYMTISEIATTTNTPIVTMYRRSNKLVKAGLVEVKERGKRSVDGKPIKMIRRRYRALTFNQDGSIVAHHHQIEK